MKPILHIRSSFTGYGMYLANNNKIVFFTQHTFTSYTTKSEELKSSGLENTMRLIEYAQNNDISSLGVEVRGPLRCLPLNIGLLNANGIDVLYIKDKTPIPHNGCRPHKEKRIKFEKTNL